MRGTVDAVVAKQIQKLTEELRAEQARLGLMVAYGASGTHYCPICGAEREGPEQIDTMTLGSTFSTTVDGRYRTPCPTPRCGEVCKICRNEVGDVHGPDCGPLMVTKLERPHIVDRSDCT